VRQVHPDRHAGGASACLRADRGRDHARTGDDICAAAETLLFEASRAQLVQRVIRPALERGAIVLCDRFADSTTAYQGYGRGFDIEALRPLHEFALGGTWPDITLLLDLDAELGFRRIQARNGGAAGLDRMERESLAFHQRVVAGFREMAGRWPERFRRVDAAGTVDTVHETIWTIVKEVLS